MQTRRGVEPGDIAPEFNLSNANEKVGGSDVDLKNVVADGGGVIMFTCNHCPYVVASEGRIEEVAEMARASGLGFIGINSNDPEKYPTDNWENMVKRAEKGMSYPYLHDASQHVAASYGAERTPEFYLVSNEGNVIYRGRLDDSPRDPSNASTSELADAIREYVSGQRISVPRTDSIGCSVNWKN